jgi:hypothetical protein
VRRDEDPLDPRVCLERRDPCLERARDAVAHLHVREGPVDSPGIDPAAALEREDLLDGRPRLRCLAAVVVPSDRPRERGPAHDARLGLEPGEARRARRRGEALLEELEARERHVLVQPEVVVPGDHELRRLGGQVREELEAGAEAR